VKIKNVLIHVQDFVALMQSVMYKIILPAVIAYKDILEILQWHVTKYLHQLNPLKPKIHGITILVANIVTSKKEIINAFAHAYQDT
jgi:Ca2+/H+ antiporter